MKSTTLPDRLFSRSRAERRPGPPPSVYAFALLLVLVFAASYAVGSLAGPVAPGMREQPSGGEPERSEHGGDGGGHSLPAPDATAVTW
ncbi:hypothetical protein [Streptomyces litchfieldiae]|uniref:Secreted protein n=1 Tax=Streptomyces litchfieldiae TaxID=3075543 RepID=A0ABU2MY48_9ACTN|nr:hypothetical protein [Streptomyces sp. DSM 44938]MDT0346441.1 hypothetical protein [Streptomyces sp. DSM 44938]